MPVQDAYQANIEPAYEGMPVDMGLYDRISKVAEGSDIDFGRAVVRGTADNQAILPSATGQDFVGVTEYTTGWSNNVNNVHLYTQYREMNLIRFGRIWVYTETAVVPGDDVYFRHTAGVAPNNIVGRFRNDADGATADQIVGATFETTSAAASLAIIQLN